MAEEVKRKRGRPRKVKLPEEVQSKVVETLLEMKEQEKQEVHEFVEEYKAQKRKGEWDISTEEILNMKVPFFDAELSYELTGYKPITESKGLDFNPDWFTEARDTYNRTGHYTQYPFGTKAYRDFWNEQYKRCKNGYTVNGYTVTGFHYFFLNFYQLKDGRVSVAGGARNFIFPRFMSAQYEYFHYFELARKLGKNVSMMKSRGVGFSEITAGMCDCEYSCYKNSITLVTAATDNYVKKTFEKVTDGLTFLNDKTDGGFFKLRQVVDSILKKRASYYKIVNGQKIEDGFMSQIEGIVADNDSKIRGDRVALLILEEAGSNPNLRKSFIKGEALVNVQGNKIGVIVAGGTGGDKGAALEGLNDMYYNPDTYDVLRYRHRYTASGEEVITAFFLPCYKALDLEGIIDSRGVCDQKKAKEYYDNERAKRSRSPKALIDYSAEYCYTAEEAFALEGENKFNKVYLSNQLANIKLHKLGPEIQRGDLQFIWKSGDHSNYKNIAGVRWIADPKGPICIIEHPMWEQQYARDRKKQLQKEAEREGVTPDIEEVEVRELMKNLYVAGIDSIDIGQEQTSDYTDDPSKFCIVIKKRIRGLDNPMYVAYYMERPDNEREAYERAAKLMIYYNSLCNIEASRLSMLSWAKRNGFGQHFMNRPRATYPDLNKKTSSTVGTPATQAVISHQTDLIADFVDDYSETIWFPEFLDQLLRYNDENKGKFDIVAAMGMCELADEELSGVVPRVVEEESTNEWQDVGYYKDSNGKIHFGIIPKKEERKLPGYTWKHQNYDPSRNQTSNPRYFYGSV